MKKRSMDNHAEDKAKDFKGTLIKLLKYLKPYKTKIILVLFLAICSTLFTIISPKILGKATTSIFGSVITSSKIDFIHVANILLTLLAIYVASTIFYYLQSFIMAGVTQKVIGSLREKMSVKINKLPLGYFDNKAHGDTLSRITNDVELVNEALNFNFTQTITIIIGIVGIVVIMLYISPLLTLIGMISIILSFGLMIFIMIKSQKFFTRQQEYLGTLNGHIEETYSAHDIVRAYNAEDKVKKVFNKVNNNMYESTWKGQFYSSLMMPISNFVGNIGYVLICIIGGYLVIKAKITVGDIQAFIQYIRSLNQHAGQSANIFGSLQSTIAACERIFIFLEEPEEIDVTSKSKSLSRVKGKIEFNNIEFSYDKEKKVIKDFNIHIKAGQKVAIVGPTGSGKTTLVNLLMRYYDLDKGSILIDNIDIKELKRKDLRKNIGMVLQDTWLFKGTIKENISYSNSESSLEDVKKAAKLAHAHEFIKTLPNGYDFLLDEETSNVSEGQRQLLTIARTVLANPSILILDEATSSIDTRTELLIQKAMENLMKNKTSIIIAHRLSTIKNADVILVLKNGSVVEQGNHEDLIKKKGFYYKLYNSQFEGKNI